MKDRLKNLTKELFPTGIASQVLARMLDLPPATHKVTRQMDIDVPGPDGITLKTDLYMPREPGPRPTIMMRTPYGRFGYGTVAEVYAERGYVALLQACRGTDGSSGEFDPLINERADGLATLDWLEKQPWYDGRIGLSGPSYMGYCQWAICDRLPDNAALCAYATAADFQNIVFPGNSFALQLWLSWLQTIFGLEKSMLETSLRMAVGDIERRTVKTAMTLPLCSADKVAVGQKVPFWQQWFDSAIDNPAFWEKRNHRQRLTSTIPPNAFLTGWYDLMLDQQLADYARLREQGCFPHLTIGPWYHVEQDLLAEGLKQTLRWMDAHLRDNRNALRKNPVRIFITGRKTWHECKTYPPARADDYALFLAGPDRLQTSPGPDGADTYRYDPADPTPNIGGAIFAFSGAGLRSNNALEARPDVRTYTSDVLENELTIIGNPEVDLFVRSSLAHTDFFVRLCDVSPKGISTNICDGILRLTPENQPGLTEEVTAITITMHACAHAFGPGHRIRLQVSSGAHPRYARNLGTGDAIGTATGMRAADQQIFSGTSHPACLHLPHVELERT